MSKEPINYILRNPKTVWSTQGACGQWCGLQTFLSPLKSVPQKLVLITAILALLSEWQRRGVSPDKHCILALLKKPTHCLAFSSPLPWDTLIFADKDTEGYGRPFTSDSLHLLPGCVSERSNHRDRDFLKKTAAFPDPAVLPGWWQRLEAHGALWSPSPGHPAGPRRPSRLSCCMQARLPCKHRKQREQLGELSF